MFTAVLDCHTPLFQLGSKLQILYRLKNQSNYPTPSCALQDPSPALFPVDLVHKLLFWKLSLSARVGPNSSFRRVGLLFVGVLLYKHSGMS